MSTTEGPARVLSTALGPVEVQVSGSGPAVIAVHGLPGNWRQCASISEDHAAACTVILVSRPGYGLTPLSSGRTPDAQGDLWAAVLSALGIDRAVAVGVSAGGPSAATFAARHPDRCAGLVLCSAVAIGAMPTPASMRAFAAIPGVWSLLAALHTRRMTPERAAAQMRAELTPTELAALDPGVLERFAAESLTWFSGRGMRNDVRSLAAAACRCADIPASAVVLHGEADDVVPLGCAEHYAAIIPRAELRTIPDVGHALLMSARGAVNDAVRSLVSAAAG